MTKATAVVVDYGIGNVLSVVRALEYCGATVQLTDDQFSLQTADRLVIPGVGAFGDCIQEFRAHGFEEPVREFISTGKPLLGICVGMQILFDRSLEFGEHTGLGLIPGEVRHIPKIDLDNTPLKIPHIGWAPIYNADDTDIEAWNSTVLAGLHPGDLMYFVHSYAAYPTESRYRLADTNHGGHKIAAAVRYNNVFGTQFHPEKSGKLGLSLIENFLRL